MYKDNWENIKDKVKEFVETQLKKAIEIINELLEKGEITIGNYKYKVEEDKIAIYKDNKKEYEYDMWDIGGVIESVLSRLSS